MKILSTVIFAGVNHHMSVETIRTPAEDVRREEFGLQLSPRKGGDPRAELRLKRGGLFEHGETPVHCVYLPLKDEVDPVNHKGSGPITYIWGQLPDVSNMLSSGVPSICLLVTPFLRGSTFCVSNDQEDASVPYPKVCHLQIMLGSPWNKKLSERVYEAASKQNWNWQVLRGP
jgi:hypothetical protein